MLPPAEGVVVVGGSLMHKSPVRLQPFHYVFVRILSINVLLNALWHVVYLLVALYYCPDLDMLTLEVLDPLIEATAHVNGADWLHVLRNDSVFEVDFVIVLRNTTTMQSAIS